MRFQMSKSMNTPGPLLWSSLVILLAALDLYLLVPQIGYGRVIDANSDLAAVITWPGFSLTIGVAAFMVILHGAKLLVPFAIGKVPGSLKGGLWLLWSVLIVLSALAHLDFLTLSRAKSAAQQG